MSSLSQQLKLISEQNASVALDRKARSKIHSRSLLFDAKTASAQDYDYIFQIASEALDDLIELDSRFSKFKGSLFSDTSVNYDRNVQTQETLDQLNKNIEAFLNLISPYYALAPSLKATEWLVRRFYINIHNAEVFLLTALPYYQESVFVKILNVIPKTSFPKIFGWVLGYKDLLKNPPNASILKSFRNDPEFYRLYSEFLLDQISNKTIFNEQLVFFLSNSVQVLASYNKDLQKLNDTYIPTILEVIGKLLLPLHSEKVSRNSTVYDVKLTAYSLVAVLGTIVPLNPDLICSFTEAILQDDRSLDVPIRKQTLTVIAQIWHYFNAEEKLGEKFPCFDKLSSTQLLSNDILTKLVAERCNVNKFLAYFFLSSSKDEDSLKLLKFIDFKSSPVLYKHLVKNLIKGKDEVADVSVFIPAFEYLLKENRDLFNEALQEEDKSISELEMILMHNLNDSEAEADVELEDEEIVVEAEEVADLKSLKTSTITFLDSSSSEEFNNISKAFIAHLRDITSQYRPSVANFGKTVFKNDEVFVSFLLRVSFTPVVPIFVRLLSLQVVKDKVSNEKRPKKVQFYLLVPILFLGLYDQNRQIRNIVAGILNVLNSKKDEKAKNLFMENQIYGSTEAEKRAIIAPEDSSLMMDNLYQSGQISVEDVVIDHEKLQNLLFDSLFKSTTKLKKFGQLLLKTFVLNQWSLPHWPVALKSRVWKVISAENSVGSDDRFFFLENDILEYTQNRDDYIRSARDCGLDFQKDVEVPLVTMVGGKTSNENNLKREVDWLVSCLKDTATSLQVAANEQLIKVFPTIKSVELKLQIANSLIELNETNLVIDTLETLQAFVFDHDTMIAFLSSVQIVSQVPEQGVAKRRRRSSSSTKQNMARDDISNMASAHLKKLTIILDLLQSNLEKHVQISQPDLLQSLFKSLTDLDYLGNDGNLPVLYAQETLASCMLLTIKQLASNETHTFDSNSIRADLIVNSIRLSNSPQVQNRLLLVIAELASLAPEIILHSVMPIFTFMGAHTVRQDDEFSSSALQQTIAKVIPALATSGSSSLSNEIEFLLTSFATAFQHIPRHRRVNLFLSLSRTLGSEKSLSIIIFLIGQQFCRSYSKGKIAECNSLIEFSGTFLQSFASFEVLNGLANFHQLWNEVPVESVDKDDALFNKLSGRSIFGSSIAGMTTPELVELKANLLRYVNEVLNVENISPLKLKISLILLDSQLADTKKQKVLAEFNQVTSLVLSSLELYTGVSKYEDLSSNLYDVLSSLLNLLPLDYFVKSILTSMKDTSSPLAIRIAKNFAVLASSKFEEELNANSVTENIEQIVITELLPVLKQGVETVDNTELVQAYLNTYASVVNKFGATSSLVENSKSLIEALKVVVSDKGLLSEKSEVIISSINVVSSIVNMLGVKTIGLFPKILQPALKIWERTVESDESDSDDENDEPKLLQASILALLSCLVKKMPAFVTSSLDKILLTVLYSDLIDANIRSSILDLINEHIDSSQLLKSLCNLCLNEKFYENANANSLGLYLSCLQSTVDKSDRKQASLQSTLFMKWLIKSFEFRNETGDEKYNINTVNRLESSFHSCGLSYVMKLNDKSFRPLFVNLVRWAINGEDAISTKNTEVSRLLAFFKFFNKLQESLKSIITSYFSYCLDGTASILTRFANGDLQEINLRRIVLNSLVSSFKYDQEEYWSQQVRFDSIMEPLLKQLSNIEDSIGKYLVKAITSFVTNVSSEEYNEKLVNELIKYISNENDNDSNTKIWAIKTLKSIFQKMGDQWLSYLPTIIPYIAELLEDDDEAVEMEVRKGLVRVIENVLGEPLDRYLD